jgi:hypothetical protein
VRLCVIDLSDNIVEDGARKWSKNQRALLAGKEFNPQITQICADYLNYRRVDI